MKIANVTGYSFSNYGFRGENDKPAQASPMTPQTQPDYYNPVNVKKEKGLAVLSTTGLAAGIGLAVGAGIKLLSNASNKVAAAAGAALALITLGLTLPSKLYHTNINATVKKKEMDVFTADKELQKDLTKDVHQEVLNPEVDLDKKLNDNIKLHLANNAALVNFPLQS